jgi:hypothetical protein
VFYVAGGVLLAAWAQGLVSAGARLNYLRRLFVPGIALGLVCAIVLYAALPVTARTLTLGNRIISQEMDGWRELAGKVQAVRVACGDAQMPVVALHRALAAELGFYLPDRPRVYEWPMDVMVYSQYGVWQIETPPTNGWDAVVVAEAAVNRPPELFRDFSSIEQLDDIVTRDGARRFAVYVARGLKDWPRVRYHF